MDTASKKTASEGAKSNPATRKPTKTPDAWRKDLIEAADGCASVVISLARMKGDFFSVQEALCRAEIDDGSRCFVITTMSSDDPDEPGIVNKRLSPMRAASVLWGIACFEAFEYVDDQGEALSKMRAQLTIIGADNSELNDPESSRKVINCAVDGGTSWMSDDESDIEGSSLASRNRQLTNQNLRVMARIERMMDRRESQVGVTIENAELLGKAAAALVESRLEAADVLATAVTDAAQDSAWQARLDDYGDKVGAIVLPKLDAWLESMIAKNNATAAASSSNTARATPESCQPPASFMVWCSATYGHEYLEEVVSDLAKAPAADDDGRREFWTAVLERIGEICEADEKELPPEECKQWARDLSKRLTLNLPKWAIDGES